jgi:hypothetical protein
MTADDEAIAAQKAAPRRPGTVDFFEQRRIPFVFAANCFHGNRQYTEQQRRKALSLSDPATVVRTVDARDRDSVHAAEPYRPVRSHSRGSRPDRAKLARSTSLSQRAREESVG